MIARMPLAVPYSETTGLDVQERVSSGAESTLDNSYAYPARSRERKSPLLLEGAVVYFLYLGEYVYVFIRFEKPKFSFL